MIIDKGHKMTLTTIDGRKVPVRLEVNPKARRLILRIDERQREAVAVAPSRGQLSEVAGFAADRIDWLAGRLEAIPERTLSLMAQLFRYAVKLAASAVMDRAALPALSKAHRPVCERLVTLEHLPSGSRGF